MGVELEPLDEDLREARRYLPLGDAAARDAFARRQLRARRRLTQLLAFYRANPCRMARTMGGESSTNSTRTSGPRLTN